METQCNVLSYRINLYFYDYKLATKIDENGHSNKNIDYEIKRQKAKKKKSLVINLLELILTRKILELSVKYLDY